MKKRKLALIIALSLGLITIVAYFVVDSIVDRKIDAALKDNLPGILQYKAIDTDILSATVSIRDVTLATDSFSIYLPKASLNLHLWKTVFSKDVVIKKIAITGLKAEGNVSNFDAYQEPGENKRITRVILDEIFIEKSSIDLDLRPERPHIEIPDLNIKLFDVEWNKGLQSLEDFELEIPHSSLLSPDSLYQITLKQISGRPEKLTINELAVRTNTKKDGASKFKGHEIDWYELSGLKIVINNWNTDEWTKSKKLIFNYVELVNGDMKIFRDKRYPMPERADRPLPREFVAAIPLKFYIDSVRSTGFNISYEELVHTEAGAGKINFDNLKATIFPVTNIPQSEPTTAVASCLLMSQTKLDVTFKFPTTENQKYTVSGSMAALDLKTLNPMIRPVALVNIKDGKANALSFDFIYNDEISQGTAVFEYQDLKIETLEKTKMESNPLDEILKSLVVNAFIIDKENVRDDNLRTGEVQFERDKKKSVINYWWKSLFTGIKSSVMQ